MSLEQLLELPNERLLELRATIDKLSELSPEDKSKLKARLRELRSLEKAERQKQREAYVMKREVERQARRMFLKEMTAEEKKAFQAELKTLDKEAQWKLRREHAKKALEDEGFRARAEEAALEAISKRKKDESEKKKKAE
ncbi:MAG: hypothetical protein MK080_07840 [Opitutales bacterium]|nr:hypothetical protein [Opitutales bacterium]NRA26540.1 hypothetical protein [Opitutales bacterium]